MVSPAVLGFDFMVANLCPMYRICGSFQLSSSALASSVFDTSNDVATVTPQSHRYNLPCRPKPRASYPLPRPTTTQHPAFLSSE